MPTRSNDIEQLQGVRGISRPVTGKPTGLVEAIVTSITASHGVLDAQPVGRRGTSVGCRYPLWYEPQLGDHVLIAELQGDEQLRVVLQAMQTKTGAAPKVKT